MIRFRPPLFWVYLRDVAGFFRYCVHEFGWWRGIILWADGFHRVAMAARFARWNLERNSVILDGTLNPEKWRP